MALVEVKCVFCRTTKDVKKHGKGHSGNQRYRCYSCSKTFQLDYVYGACKHGTHEQIVKLSENNTGVRGTARALGISINVVARALKKAKPQNQNNLKAG